jgi:uncharacterized membrane protein YhiD involved in acid resistance
MITALPLLSGVAGAGVTGLAGAGLFETAPVSAIIALCLSAGVAVLTSKVNAKTINDLELQREEHRRIPE